VVFVILIVVFAVVLVVVVWRMSLTPGNEEPAIGDNLPYPSSVWATLPFRPRPGTPESLTSHEDPDWVHAELSGQERHDQRREEE